MKEDNDIRYIASRYRRGVFSVDKAWRRLNIAPDAGWRRFRLAAAIASAIVVSATAAIVYTRHGLNREPMPPELQQQAIAPDEVVKIIDFEDASLTTVVAKIKEVYGVEVVNLPADTDVYRISLRYEGNVKDLIAAINEILNTQMAVKK